MKHFPHILAGVITVVSAIVFMVLKSSMGWSFGFRTYWPVFLVLYLVVWYIASTVKEKSTATSD